MNRVVTAVIGLTLAFSSTPHAALANTGAEGALFDDVVVRYQKELKKTGTGMLRYMRVFKVYNAAFYLESGASVDEVLDDKAKRFEVSYLRSFSGEDFGDATYKALRKSIPEPEIDRLRPRIEYHNSLYESVQPGDRYAVTYIPGRGTELARNGKLVGVIEGADFAAALFSIWVGENPIDPDFKNALLGLR
jgi:hypothetical protein